MTNKTTFHRWLVVIPALLLPLLASFFYFIWFPGTAFGNSFYIGVKFFTLLFPFVAVWWILKEKFADDPRPKLHRKGIIWGTVFGLLTFAVLIGLVKFSPMAGVLDENGHKIYERMAGMGIGNPALFIAFAIFVSFLHSALEEFFWRYFAFGQLRKLVPVGMAILLGSIGFALHHIVVLSQYIPLGLAFLFGACVGIGGAVWCWLFNKTNSLVGAWISHMIVDLAIMWVGWEILQKFSAS